MSWTVHPARHRPFVALLTLAFIVGVAVVAAHVIGVRWLSVPFAVVLLGSVSSFFFPTNYRLDDDSITVRHLGIERRRPLAEVRRIELGRTAALLSPFRRPRRLDRYRALLVRLDRSPPEVRDRLQALSERTS